MNDKKLNDKPATEQFSKVKPYQETNEEIANNDKLKQKQPTLKPDDFEEIEY
ncbi:hypothetical protein [Virgibacillus sp. JSM 102003]|uniref:hypothetical protein n=1 Tax=Virgibacillus sp. JSM 102003 TaxID=1562108 RepID=UPI0035C0A1FA